MTDSRIILHNHLFFLVPWRFCNCYGLFLVFEILDFRQIHSTQAVSLSTAYCFFFHQTTPCTHVLLVWIMLIRCRLVKRLVVRPCSALFISVGSWYCLCTEHGGSIIAIKLIRSPTKATLQGYNLHTWGKRAKNVMRAYAKWPFKADSCSSWVFLCRLSRQSSRNLHKLVGLYYIVWTSSLQHAKR